MKIDDKTLIVIFDSGWNIYFACRIIQCYNKQMFYQYLYQLNTSEARERYNRIIIYDTDAMNRRCENYENMLMDLKDVCNKWNYKLVILEDPRDIEKYLEK